MSDLPTKRLGFMAILTLGLVSAVQVVCLAALWSRYLSPQEYLTAWLPMVSMALGFWFGKGEEK